MVLQRSNTPAHAPTHRVNPCVNTTWCFLKTQPVVLLQRYCKTITDTEDKEKPPPTFRLMEALPSLALTNL